MSRLPPPTELQILARLRRGEILFPPLELDCEGLERSPAGVDAIARITWGKRSVRFVVESKRQASPKALDAAATHARNQAYRLKLRPLVIVPFLDEAALELLESKAVSGIDLCGNGLVVVPGRWYVRRTGSPNAFRPEGTIKNVYRKSSSVAARLFLAEREFGSVQEALLELRRRGGKVTLPTVSKVCRRLEEDLIIERKRGEATRLRLIQPAKLLDRLAENYEPPTISRRVAGKLQGVDPEDFRARLRRWAKVSENQVARTGVSSVAAYAVMARGGAEEYYCSDAADAVRALDGKFVPTERFATITLMETPDEEVYFDRRDDLTSSPVQTFLELSHGDKRDRETAEQVREVILKASESPGAS